MARRSRAQMLDETHRLLVEAGRGFFGEHGYSGTSMDELTASAGLTRGALYHHFGGKDGLFAAVVAAMDAEIDTGLNNIAEQATDPLAALVDRSVAYIELTQAADVQQVLFQDAPSVLPEAAESSTAACIASIVRLIERSQAAGLLKPAPPSTALAVLINGALIDASRWVATAPDGQHDARLDEARDSARLIVSSLRTP